MGDKMNDEEIVKITDKYNSKTLLEDISLLKRRYEFLETGNIGNSVLGKNIPYIAFGKGKREIAFNGAIHANEWITAMLLMKFIEWIAFTYSQKNHMYEMYDLENIFNNKKVYFTPMINPDGVDLLTGGLTEKQINNMLEISKNYSNIPFPNGWKANFNGVDLNLQFPANWEKAKEIKFSQGFKKPGPRDFVGEGPLTEPEALALYNFTLQHNFEIVISYHTQGQVIYYKYLDMLPQGTLKIAREMSRVSGYVLEETPYASSFAGYKDWFIQQYNKPGFTIEAGYGENPLPISQFKQIYKDNFGIIMTGIQY